MTELAAETDDAGERRPEDDTAEAYAGDAAADAPGGAMTDPSEDKTQAEAASAPEEGSREAQEPDAPGEDADAAGDTVESDSEPAVPEEPTRPEAEQPAVPEAEMNARPADEEQRESDGSAGQAAEGASEAGSQAAQDALFSTDLPPVIASQQEDEGVTVFGGPADDLAAIRAELNAEPGEQPAGEGAVDTATVADAAAVAAAGAAADEEAIEAVVQTGAPEGADDDPEAVEAFLDAESQAGVLGERTDRLLSVPFFVYLGIWLVFSVAMFVTLQSAAAGGTLDTSPAYAAFVLAGLVLTIVGPLLTLVVFLMKRSRTAPQARQGLFATALLRGALSTFGGVVMWWIALIMLNYVKTGRFF